jgi:general stress protein 26
MSETASREEGLKKVRSMIKDIDFCMLTTMDEQGCLHSRPMSTNKQVDFNGDLWFFTYGQSHKAAEVRRNQKVNVSYADPSKQNYVSLSGNAVLVRDREEIKKRWQPALKAWFPKGPDEPDIALLKVSVERAEYWDAPSSAVAHVVSLAKAMVTGKPANPAENKKVEL